ncbi:hypothetical protein ACJQWK_08937 [Exserohilum turcicum]|uniref:Uncharacterized protein n=1 Tax=Exserohilum turcicum (strain 28A) TaxID=671987 RepID=R0INS4_EXST2|nr:uncharacterized protein SETTUDRAFT_19113 [Exserohilum turcica Et28A]EOA86600.1 hypothetical protein SETTUDRAFT_19113 [Exserohilum turcica Et28A]
MPSSHSNNHVTDWLARQQAVRRNQRSAQDPYPTTPPDALSTSGMDSSDSVLALAHGRLARDLEEEYRVTAQKFKESTALLAELRRYPQWNPVPLRRRSAARAMQLYDLIKIATALEIAEARERRFYEWWRTLSTAEQQARLSFAQDVAPRRWPDKAWL